MVNRANNPAAWRRACHSNIAQRFGNVAAFIRPLQLARVHHEEIRDNKGNHDCSPARNKRQSSMFEPLLNDEEARHCWDSPENAAAKARKGEFRRTG